MLTGLANGNYRLSYWGYEGSGWTLHSSITNPNRIFSTLKGYINAVANFEKYSLSGVTLRSADITQRAIEVAIQPGKATLEQSAALSNAFLYAREKGIEFTLHFIQ